MILTGAAMRSIHEHIYQIPNTLWSTRLTAVMPAQQQAPMKIGFPPVFMSFTRLVLRPMAAMASTMKNLLSSLMGDGGEDGGSHEVKDEKWEYILETYRLSLGPVVFFFVPGPDEGQEQGDGDDGQGPGKLYGNCFVQGGGAKVPHAVPGGCGSCYG